MKDIINQFKFTLEALWGSPQELAVGLLGSHRWVVPSPWGQRSKWLTVVLLFLSMARSASGQENIHLVFGGDHSYPPYEYLDERGEAAGFNVDLANAISEEMGLTSQIRLSDWESARKSLSGGKIDVLMGMIETDERKKDLLFSTPHFMVSYAVFVPKESSITSFKETEGKKIIVQNGDFGHEYLLETRGDGLIQAEVTAPAALFALAAGRGDAALIPRVQGLMILKESGLDDTIGPVGPPILQMPFCFSVKKGDERILSLLNEGLKAVKASGRYDEIFETWFGAYTVDEGFSYRDIFNYVAMVTLPLFGLALLIFAWSYSLKRQVRYRTEELSMANEMLNREVRERVIAERALRQSEERYREIFNTPTDGIMVHDAISGVVLDANNACLSLMGYAPQELLGMSIGDISLGDDGFTDDEAIALVRRAAAGDPQLITWKMRRKDGSIIWAECSLKSADLSDRTYVISVARDITARKMWETRLFEEKERLAVTLKSIGDGVITSDVRGRVVLMNKVAEKLTGWSQAEAAGRPMVEVFRIINEKSRKVCENPVDKVLTTGNTITLANHTALIARDGRERSIADSGAPIRDRSGAILGVVLVFRDVTDENRMEEEILKARKLESVGVLAGGIAHDFNNILMAILGGVSLARAQSDESCEVYRLLTDVLKAGRRARDLTQQLLTFSKGGDPVTCAASVAEVVRESAGFVLHGSRVRCDIRIAEDLWPAEIDASQISQVVQNLILNSVQAMPKGGVILIQASNHTIDPSAMGKLPLKANRYVKINFIDDGPGIPKEVIDKVFDPFFTTKETGSGLGLATTHSIISKHDGYIQAGTSPTGGACFTFYLPASDGEPEEIHAIPVPEVPLSTRRILVMDDEALVRDVVKGLLTRMGHEVELASGGDEAVDLWQKRHKGPFPYDLVIMDLTVAGAMGGLEAATQILALSPDARLVVSSGYSNDPVMADYKAHGFCAAIVKPYTFADLNEVVFGVLNNTPS